MQRPDRDDIEKLSRGQRTRAKIGNRGIGHRLTQKERILFEAAKRQGYLKIPAAGLRANVENIWRLWCEAEGRECIIRQTTAVFFPKASDQQLSSSDGQPTQAM